MKSVEVKMRGRGKAGLALIRQRLESYPCLDLERARRYEMRAAKRRKKVIESNLIEDVSAGESQSKFLVLCSQQVVRPNTEIEKMTRRNTRRISVVILSTVGGNTYTQSPTMRVSASENRRCRRGEGAAAEQPDLRLLVRR